MDEFYEAYDEVFDEEEKVRQRYQRIRLKKQVLLNLSLILRSVDQDELDPVVYSKFFVKSSFGNRTFLNVNFAKEYAYFLMVCDVTKEICISMGVDYQVETLEEWVNCSGLLQQGVMVKQCVSATSFLKVHLNVFSKRLQKVIDQKDLSDVGDCI